MKYFYLFKIGPVQAFIATARKSRDLAVGSRLLSKLATAGIGEAQSHKANLVYPVTLDDGQLPQSVPHRFAFVAEGDPQKIARAVKHQIESQWAVYARQVETFIEARIGGGQWQSAFTEQVSQWPQVTWAAVPYDQSHHSEAVEAANRVLAARANTNWFSQINEVGGKCTLSGAQAALPLNWKRLREKLGDRQAQIIRENERLGALALLKRLIHRASGEFSDIERRFPDTSTIAGFDENTMSAEDGERYYFAVLAMDGDHIGMHLRSLHTLADHQQFSRTLARFAQEDAPQIVQQHNGNLLYAGGDDVLAYMPKEDVLACAEALRQRFAERFNNQLHSSAGIALAPHNYPLDLVLQTARAAERAAKTRYGRNAVVVQETNRSGQIREAGAHWEVETMSVLKQILNLRDAFQSAGLSLGIAYDILELRQSLDDSKFPHKGDTLLADEPTGRRAVLQQARNAELTRLLHRRIDPSHLHDNKHVFAEEWSQRLQQLARGITWEGLANWLILARFLAKEANK